jgi:hypothetical protein
MTSRFLAYLPSFFLSFILLGQVNNYTKNEVLWDTIPCRSIAPTSKFLTNDAVILDEHYLVNFVDLKRVYITKIIQVKILNEKALAYFNNFYLPETNDPFTDYSGSSVLSPF